jgi:hypothetical protein
MNELIYDIHNIEFMWLSYIRNNCFIGCKLNGRYARFEILPAVRMTMLLFWVVKPCKLVGRHQCFGETYCIHLQGVATQKNNIVKLYLLQTQF